MTTTVRRATRDDAAQISEVIDELSAEPQPVGIDTPMSPAAVVAWMDRQGDYGALFVVDDGRHILAFASIDFDSARPQDCSFGAWVRPRNRRQGHATALAEEALAFARDRGYRRVRGWLPEGNEPALSFLSAIGALVPLMNPGASYELPIDEERA